MKQKYRERGIRTKAKDHRFWEEVRTNQAYRFFIDELLVMYEEDGNGDIVDISYDTFMEYFRTGSRAEFDEKYNMRRRRLCSCALLSLIYPDNQKYISNLQNTIWAICNEYSWAKVAHIEHGDTEYNDICIDLFAAETGFALSEIRFLLEDRLGSLLNQRIHREIEKRIIWPFLHNSYNWERSGDNWAAVCTGSVACTVMYERPELFYELKPRFEQCLESFLSGYKADGVCREGLTYWQYGFGFYVAYAQRLLEFSEGKINLFENEKVKEIAQFPSKAFLDGKATISFSDAGMSSGIGYGTMFLLREHYGELISMFPRDICYNCYVNGRWQLHLESIVFFDPGLMCTMQKEEAIYYMKESQWFTKRCTAYGFAAKGGTNKEPHNHNDLGSFIFCHGGRQVLVDLGCGQYTKDYFGPKRYEILCNRSAGHSVPFVDGQEQAYGSQYTAQMEYDGQILSINITEAYPQTRVKKLLRNFTFHKNRVLLRDCFLYENNSDKCPVQERLVTLIKPEIAEGCVKLDEVRIEYDSSSWSVSVTEDIHKKHNGAGEFIPVYLIDFVSDREEKEFCVEIKVEEEKL